MKPGWNRVRWKAACSACTSLPAIPLQERAGGSLVFLGRIHPDKGVHLAIEVARLSGMPLLIAGIIQDRTYFREQVEPKLNDTIRYIGPVDVAGKNDLRNPAKVIGVADSWILQPEDPWEITGYVHNVVFSCGAVAEPDGTVKIYWGGADTVMCAGEANISDLVALCRDHARPAK